jgi:hypothetical protein
MPPQYRWEGSKVMYQADAIKIGFFQINENIVLSRRVPLLNLFSTNVPLASMWRKG